MIDTQFERLTEYIEHIPLSPQRVDFKMLSQRAKQLLEIYLATVADEEHPREAMERTGYTPRELGLRRTKAHNELMRQLSREGVDCSNRYAITELAFRYDAWSRE